MEEGDVYSGAGSLTRNSILRLNSWILSSWLKLKIVRKLMKSPLFDPKLNLHWVFSGLGRGNSKQDYEKTPLNSCNTPFAALWTPWLSDEIRPRRCYCRVGSSYSNYVSAPILTNKERKKERNRQTNKLGYKFCISKWKQEVCSIANRTGVFQLGLLYEAAMLKQVEWNFLLAGACQRD